MRLERRDRQVLVETYLSRVVQRRHLTSLGYFGSVSRCNARLLALKQAGLLSSRTELGGLALRAPVYSCTRKGADIASTALGFAPDDAVAAGAKGIRDSGVRHALACLDLRVAMERDLGDGHGVRLSKWFHEALCHHEFETRAGRLVTVKPDGLAVLKTRGRENYVFVEADLGNVSLHKFREKTDRYSDYRESGAFADAYGTASFHVLTVTTDERRLANLSRLSTEPQFLFTTWRRMSESTLCGRIVARLGEAVTLAEAVEAAR